MTQHSPTFRPRIFTRAGDGTYYEDDRVIAAVDVHSIGGQMSITISEWASITPGRGHSETALRWLRSQGYAHITANGVGLIEDGVGAIATAYWLHMHSKGLVDTLLDDDGRDVTPAPLVARAAGPHDATPPLLLVVHPGSACGSADMHLDRFEARAARSALCQELNTWHGGVLLIDGDLSSELPSYPLLNDALLGALARARAGGLIAARLKGCDNSSFTQVHAIGKFVDDMGAHLHGVKIRLTGAWYAADGGGCVGSVKRELARRGIDAEVADSVVWEPSDDHDNVTRAPSVDGPTTSATTQATSTTNTRRPRP